jgi:ubiquinone/menaquinone biosynthesis C-methylase UbiE
VKEYYEELWRGLPHNLNKPAFERRRSYLLGEVRTGDRALDLGCGEGDFTEELVGAGASAIGIDVAEAALARARARHPQLDFRIAPVDGPLPLEDNTHDLVWASEVIEHVSDTAKWLSEIRRVLAPGGRLLLTTPNHSRLLIALFGVEQFSDPLGDHLHLYTRRSLRTLFNEFGFDDVHVRAAGGPPLLERMLLARGVR